MNRTLSHLAVAALVAAVLLAPAVVGEGSALSATRLVIDERTRQQGEGALFKAFDPATETSTPVLAVRAASAVVEAWEGHGTRVGGDIGQEVPDGDPQKTTTSYEHLDLRTVAVPSSFDVEVLGLERSRARIHGTFEVGEVTALENAYVTSSGIREAQPGEYPTSQTWTFSRKRADGPHVLTTTTDGMNATLRGDILLEFRGFVLGGTSREGPVALRGDYETGPVHPAAGAAEAVVQSYTYRFVRMRLENAVVEFTLPAGGEHTVQWAARTLLSQTDGNIVADGARGTLDGVTMDGERTLLPASAMELSSSDGDLVTVDFPAEAQGGVFMPPALRAGLIVLALAVAAVGLAALVVAVVLRRRVPSLARIEALLEKGDYDRAARLAGRLVRRRPDLEGARISHAIALTKGGHAAEVVDGLEAYLALHVPSDGVMHYVLGSAYLDLGNPEAARRAFREAGARTPALLQEIEPRLAAASTARPAAPSRRDGDAQAYA